jgi:hypothetical protein
MPAIALRIEVEAVVVSPWTVVAGRSRAIFLLVMLGRATVGELHHHFLDVHLPRRRFDHRISFSLSLARRASTSQTSREAVESSLPVYPTFASEAVAFLPRAPSAIDPRRHSEVRC